ncbi:MAG: zinc-binding dehydrogenase [Panacagrimonas sp.]
MTENSVNRRIIVSKRSRFSIPNTGMFSLSSTPKPKPGNGEVLIRTTWLGIEPYLYGRLKPTSSQGMTVPLGGLMVGPTVGRVEISNHPDYAEGEMVQGLWGWQDYHVSDGTGIFNIDPEIPRSSYVLGALGMSGFGAYIAVDQYLKVQRGETLIFGAALGGLGQIVGQLGKMRGARTIGAVSGAKKVRYGMDVLGFDVCIDRTASDFIVRCTQEFSKKGVDCHVMSGTAGVLQLAMPHYNRHARIAACGVMSFYCAAKLPPGPDLTTVVFNDINLKRLSVHGMVTLDWVGTPLHEQFKKEMKAWILGGQINVVEHIVDGLENAPDALQGVFEGRNFGKALVRVAD